MTPSLGRLGAVGLVLAAAALAGCVGDDGGGAGPSSTIEVEAPSEGPYVDLVDRESDRGRVVTWNGARLDGSSGGGSGCDGAACERVPFEVGPVDRDGAGADELVVTATWDPYRLGEEEGAPGADVSVRVVDGRGNVVSEGAPEWFSAVAVVEDPEPGSYAAEVRAGNGATNYTGSVHLQESPEDDRAADLLPDLVAMPVIQLTRARPVAPTSETVDGTAGTRGCSAYEMTEKGARNCLRFTTSIGNLGAGPLEMKLGFENATRAMTPLESRFTQVIHRTDGSVRERAAAQAEYHPTHEHYHYHGMAEFTLHAYDADAGTRGEVVRDGGKAGWCVVDMGLVAPSAGPYTTPALYPLEGSRQPNGGGSNCQVAAPGEPMVTGISPGWYDMYEWFADEQYVEVSDLPAGTYELVVTADPGGHVLETDATNNAAGVVFEWEDGEARVLERWSEGVGAG